MLAWALSLEDPNLIVIELNERTHSPHNVEWIRKAGKLTSINSWNRAPFYEYVFGAKCGWVFEEGVDIAVTNRPAGCVKQKH